MFQEWLTRARRELERGVLGKGRPKVGSRKSERMPAGIGGQGVGARGQGDGGALAAEPEDGAGGPQQRAVRRRGPEAPSRLPYSLAFGLVLSVLAFGFVLGIHWATSAEGGFLAAALGASEPRAAGSPPALATPAPTTQPTAAPSPTPRTYVVKAGDTLTRIAQQHETTVEALMEANELEDPELLRVGQELVIPE